MMNIRITSRLACLAMLISPLSLAGQSNATLDVRATVPEVNCTVNVPQVANLGEVDPNPESVPEFTSLNVEINCLNDARLFVDGGQFKSSTGSRRLSNESDAASFIAYRILESGTGNLLGTDGAANLPPGAVAIAGVGYTVAGQTATSTVPLTVSLAKPNPDTTKPIQPGVYRDSVTLFIDF